VLAGVGLERVEWDVLHTSEINRHIQTIFSHSVTPTMFLNANEEGYRHVSSSAVSSTHCLTPHNQPKPSNLPPDTKAYFVCHILPDTQVNEGYHAENLPNKKVPTCAFLLFGKERINILISGTKREQSRYI